MIARLALRLLAAIGGLMVAGFAALFALIALSARDLADDADDIDYLITGI